MTGWKLSIALFASIAALLAIVPGCTIGLPFRGPGYDSSDGVTDPNADDQVLVALTYTVVNGNGEERSAFRRGISSVVDSLEEQPGLIGFSVRRELFGKQAWTMSVWTDEDSLDAFVDSSAHREAMSSGGRALEMVRSLRLEVPRAEIPLSWKRVEELFDAQVEASY